MVYNGGRRIFLRKEVCGMRNSVLRFTVFIAAFIAAVVMLSAVPEKAHAEGEDVFDNHWKVLTTPTSITVRRRALSAMRRWNR